MGPILVGLADRALSVALAGERVTLPSLASMPAPLTETRGVFVTLLVSGELNGCIGTITGEDPLAHGTVRYALAAAFEDPRLPALRVPDYERLTIEVSVLSPLTGVPAATRAELLESLRPGEHGLVISDGFRRAVFLPSVWEQLPDPRSFLDRLQAKAGMRPGVWARSMRAEVFTAAKFSGPAGS